MLHHISRIRRSIFMREPALEFISHDPVWIEIYRGVETFWRRLISLPLSLSLGFRYDDSIETRKRGDRLT